ncbi:hypothetical protein M3Y97_01167700 [Aphelenchoides bicaudatus]|nr:hypothetical protein M3Y97_01167700 [Aphelenchoides bicaudatus]
MANKLEPMVYNITTNGGRDENSQMRSQFLINSSQNIGLSVEEPPSKKTEYPPFVNQVHGLSLALFAKSRKIKIFWWLVFFACTICGMWTIMLVIIEYNRAPTATSITIKLVSSLELPAITVCPEFPDALNYEPLFNNIQTRLPDITNETAIDLISFWLAGSGLYSIELAYSFNETRLVELAEMFKIWSDGYDTQSFFHMIQDEYGYKCEQLFEYCQFGVKGRDCCKELFKPIWVLYSGVCYQTRRNINQTRISNSLFVRFKSPPSIIMRMVTNHTFNTQRDLTVYVNDNYVNNNFEHVARFPTITLNPDDINELSLSARLVELQEHSKDCTNKIVGTDASCLVNKLLTSQLLDPFNCTVPYLKVPGISNNTKICDTLTIVKNYSMIIEGVRRSEDCIPGCTKWEYGRALMTRNDASGWKDGRYYFSVHFGELQYEHVREFSTITISGLISQVGGQLGLYLGLSIITLLQIVIYCVKMIARFLCRHLRPLPVDPKINQNEMHQVGNGRLHYNRDISSYV